MWFHSHGTSRQIGGIDTQQKYTCEYTFTNRGEGYIGKAEGAMKAYTREVFSNSEHKGQLLRKL